MKKLSFVLVALLGFSSFSAQADVTTAAKLAGDYGMWAKKMNPDSTLSAEAGRAFYIKKVEVAGKDLACAACHTDNPANPGKHNETGKPIKPMAPAVNTKRFSSVQKSAAAFTKHCKDLYAKDCSAQDKGDFITYLLSVK